MLTTLACGVLLALGGAGGVTGGAAMSTTGPARANVGGGLDDVSRLTLISLGTATVVASVVENQTRMQAALDGGPLDGVIDVADAYGDGRVLGGLSLGLLAIGHVLDHGPSSRLGEELGASLAGAWAVTWALKVGVDRTRPSGGSHSFPSGHTATAFAAAPVIARSYGSVAGVAAYGAATLTALARIEDDKHHLSDVIAGAAIGIMAGRTFTHWQSLTWMVPRSGVGLGLSLEF